MYICSSNYPRAFHGLLDNLIILTFYMTASVSESEHELSCVTQDASGDDGRFADPEEGSVASYSSRGPCYIDSGNGLEDRLKPVTTAATALEVSTNSGTTSLFQLI